jgi:hypothetical protein
MLENDRGYMPGEGDLIFSASCVFRLLILSGMGGWPGKGERDDQRRQEQRGTSTDSLFSLNHPSESE